MRRKYHIITACTILILVGMAVFPHTAHAAWYNPFSWVVLGDVGENFLSLLFAGVATIALYIMSLWVTITGDLLNVSITLTLHIKDFVNSTEGVYIVWQTIRDISGLFIIFALLYCSFLLILDQTSKSFGSVGNLIKNIVIGGILINFSFFITSVLIDASNIVSLALYNGIIGSPTQTTTGTQAAGGQTADCPTTTAGNLNTCVITANMINGKDGGLSGFLMEKLRPQSIYDPKNTQLAKQTTSAPLRILIQGVVGVVLMFTMGMSFLLAALAFMARLVILIVLLAFSPIWFAALIFPILKDKAKKFTDTLYSQLVFMPIYLLLLYAGMTVLKYSTVFNAPSGNVFSGTGTGPLIPVNLIVLAVNDFFILFLLNMPLVVAFSYGGMATDWLGGAVKKMGAANVWKNVGGWAGTHTVGRVAGMADKWVGGTSMGNTLLARDIRSGTIGAVAKSKMGGTRSHEERLIAQKEVAKKSREIERGKELRTLLSDTKAGKPYAIDPVTGKSRISSIIGEMNEKEKLALLGKNIKDKDALREILKHAKSSDFEAIKKSEDLMDEDKVTLGGLRKESLDDALTKGHTDVVKHMVNNMDGKELLKLGDTMLVKPGIVEHLKQSQLNMLADEGISDSTKKEIGRQILNWPETHGDKTHSAFGFITRDDNKSWLQEGVQSPKKELRVKPTRK